MLIFIVVVICDVVFFSNHSNLILSQDDDEDSSSDEDSIGISILSKKKKIGMTSSYNAEYWEAQNLKFVDSLKNVEMVINGEQNGVDLIKYLLKNAKGLEKMTIFYLYCASSRLSVISTKLQQFQKVSSSITICLLPKK